MCKPTEPLETSKDYQMTMLLAEIRNEVLTMAMDNHARHKTLLDLQKAQMNVHELTQKHLDHLSQTGLWRALWTAILLLILFGVMLSMWRQ